MKHVKLINQRTGEIIVNEAGIAANPWTRVIGLLLTKHLQHGRGLWLKPSNSIHTFGMRYSLDVLFLDKKNRVVEIVRNLRPNRVSPIVWKARSVVELPADSLSAVHLELNDQLIPAA